MTIAHIAGLPLEELLAPLILSSGGLVIAVRAALRRPLSSAVRRPVQE
jgi:hypothetical protein